MGAGVPWERLAVLRGWLASAEPTVSGQPEQCQDRNIVRTGDIGRRGCCVGHLDNVRTADMGRRGTAASLTRTSSMPLGQIVRSAEVFVFPHGSGIVISST